MASRCRCAGVVANWENAGGRPQKDPDALASVSLSRRGLRCLASEEMLTFAIAF